MTGALAKTSGEAKRGRGGVLIDIRTKNIKHRSILYEYADCNGRVGAFSGVPDHEAALRVRQRDSPQSFPELAFPLISLWSSNRRGF